jgi:hypothetical protein
MRRVFFVVSAVLMTSGVAFAAQSPEMTKPIKSTQPAQRSAEVTTPGQTGGNRPDITDAKGGIIIGGAVGGAGGLFVPWGGFADLSAVEPLPGTIVQGRCAFNATYIEKNDAPVQTAPMYTNKLRVDGADVAVNSARHLNAGEAKTVTTQPYLSEGTHLMTLQLDAGSVVAESIEGNNTFSIKYSLHFRAAESHERPRYGEEHWHRRGRREQARIEVLQSRPYRRRWRLRRYSARTGGALHRCRVPGQRCRECAGAGARREL